MIQDVAKTCVLWSISKGLRLPQSHLDRISELALLKDLLAQLQIDCVLDVGANRGQFASELRSIGYSGAIISFEPVASEYSALRKAFASDPCWQGHQIALGSVDESKPILVPKLTVLSSLLEPMGVSGDYRKEMIDIKRLDGFLPSILSPLDVSRIFLKMDTQGYDLEVFKGASGCMDNICGIQSELSVQPIYKNMPHYLEALAVYEAAGFDLYNLSVVNRTGNGGLLEMNCFMRRSRA